MSKLVNGDTRPRPTAGGIGATASLGVLRALLAAAAGGSAGALRRVKLVWVCREPALFGALAGPTLGALPAAPGRVCFECELYCTRPAAAAAAAAVGEGDTIILHCCQLTVTHWHSLGV